MATLNLTAAEKQVEAAKLKLQQATNRLRQEKAKETARQRAQDRKDRNRMLILTGAAMWNKAQASEAFRLQLLQWIDEEIPEDRNRVLFALAPKPEGSDSGKPINGGEGGSTVGQ